MKVQTKVVVQWLGWVTGSLLALFALILLSSFIEVSSYHRNEVIYIEVGGSDVWPNSADAVSVSENHVTVMLRHQGPAVGILVQNDQIKSYDF